MSSGLHVRQLSRGALIAELDETKNRLHRMIRMNADLQLDKKRLERTLHSVMRSIRDKK